MTVTEDLQRIFPDQIKQLNRRNIAFAVAAGLAVLLLVVVIVILSSLLGSCRKSETTTAQVAAQQQQQTSEGCTNPDCLHTAAFIVDNMDLAVDPCSDFHRFSCGGYKLKHPIHPDESEVTMERNLEEEVEERLREMIENPTSRLPSSSAEQKLRDFFSSCVHDYGRMKEGGKVLVDLIRNKLNGWYVLDSSGWKNQWNLQQALGRVQGDMLVNVFFITYLERDHRANKNILAFYSSGLGLSSAVYGNENKSGIQDAYKDYMRRTAALLIRDANMTLTSSEANQRIEQFVADAFDMESKLASIIKTVRSQRGAMYQKVQTTVGQLHRNFTQFDWLNLLRTMFEDFPFNDDTPVRIVAPAFFRMVDDMFRNETWGSIRDRMLNNYFAWRMVFKYSSHLSWEYREAGLRFREVQYGESEWEPTWKLCLTTVMERLGTLLATEFAKSHLPADAKQQVADMFTNLRKTLAERVFELPWMDALTQQRANEKMMAVTSLIGYADVYYNETYMNQLHSRLEIDRSAGYFTNLINVLRFQRRLKAQLFTNTDDRLVEHAPVFGWGFHYWVTPYYMWYYNRILLPSGVMIDPMFNLERPQVFNYGFLGSIMAGELLGSIGHPGSFMWTNNTNWRWWTNDTVREFNKTTSCFINYFDGLTAGPFLINNANVTLSVNGRTQANRLMDDLGGIRAALKAYQQWEQTNGQEPMPAGLLNRTPDQLFFISVAQTKCYVRTDEQAYEYARLNYLPEDQEINSILSHLPEFTKAFNCPIGSKMRTSYQCETF